MFSVSIWAHLLISRPFHSSQFFFVIAGCCNGYVFFFSICSTHNFRKILDTQTHAHTEKCRTFVLI